MNIDQMKLKLSIVLKDNTIETIDPQWLNDRCAVGPLLEQVLNEEDERRAQFAQLNPKHKLSQKLSSEQRDAIANFILGMLGIQTFEQASRPLTK